LGRACLLSLLLFFGLGGIREGLADDPGVLVDRTTVIHNALSSHPLVAIALERSRAQREKVGVARSDYYPHLTFSLDQLFLNTAFIGGVFPNYEPIAPEMFNPTLTQEITDFGSRHYRVKAVSHRLKSRKEDLREARLSVIYHANVAYDQLAMFEHLLIAARKNEEDAAIHYRMAQERLARGLGVITDVTLARVLWEKTRQRLVLERNDLKKAQADLIFAMGHEEMVDYRTDGMPHMSLPSMTLGEMISYALRHRPVLRSSMYQDREAEDRVGEVRTRNYPHISLFAQGYFLWGVPPDISGAPVGSGLFLPTFQSGLVVTIPIFVGGAIVHDTEKARMEARKESEKTRLIRIRIIRNIRKLFDDLKTQQETLSLDQIRYDHATENALLVERRFKKGLLNGVVALDAETELLTSRERLVADRFRFEMIRDGLDREIGFRRDQ
jgi:outer membrane protein